MRTLLATFLFWLSTATVQLSLAQPPTCCRACGCSQLQIVCRLVPDVKQETKTKWVVECQPVCLPGRTRCVDECVPDPNCPGGTCVVKTRQPSCGRIITKKKLVKKTETCEKPGFKCIAETICTSCGRCCQ